MMEGRDETPRLLVNGALGRLAKWLRILGFDTEEARLKSPPEPGARILITKNRALFEGYSGHAVLVRHDLFRDQVRQVAKELGLSADPKMLFTRCTLCNLTLERVARDDAAGQVPEYVWLTSKEFNRCPKCGRMYWKGTHGARVLDELEEMGII